MEETTKYSRAYLTELGPKWLFDYDFSKNEGSIKEVETDIEGSFKIHYGKVKYFSEEFKGKIAGLSENETKWIEICIDEVLFLKKK